MKYKISFVSISKHIKNFFLSMLFLVPSISYAAPTSFKGLIDLFIYYIQAVTPIVFGFAFIAFLWGLMKYVFASGNENERENGKNIMVWGLIGLFFLTSILAIVKMLGGTILPNFGGSNWPGDRGNDQFLDRSLYENEPAL